ncbi:MAG: hypothetical protein KDM63_08855, partial [Verrucomicrobiae bacterium]|nr:hypothetical protein [Verrucomicrobiae bacterium]
GNTCLPSAAGSRIDSSGSGSIARLIVAQITLHHLACHLNFKIPYSSSQSTSAGLMQRIAARHCGHFSTPLYLSIASMDECTMEASSRFLPWFNPNSNFSAFQLASSVVAETSSGSSKWPMPQVHEVIEVRLQSCEVGLYLRRMT